MKKNEQKTKVEMEKHFPWLKVFDGEFRSLLTNTEVGVNYRHVIQALVFLERNVSSEISKLRTRPIRATYFLDEIRKRFTIIKVSVWLADMHSEEELLPTFGLLMQHFVNITLASSKMGLMSLKILANELYYLLKLMFEVDTEYVLDVVLCSNLGEHGSTDDVGFYVYSNIVDDWCAYIGIKSSESTKMKYSYVASLLSESVAGQRIIEMDLPLKANVSKEFVVYLNNTLGMKLEVTKNYRYINIVESIKTERFITAMSRRRLIIVSVRDISRKRVLEHEDDRNADSHRRKSTLITFENSQIFKNQNLCDSSEDDQLEVLPSRLDATGSYNNTEVGERSNEDDSLGTSSAKRRRTSSFNTDTMPIHRNVKIDGGYAKEIQIDEDNNGRAGSGKSSHPLSTRKSSLEKVEIPSEFHSMDPNAERLGARSTDGNVNEDALGDITSDVQQRELISKKLKEELAAKNHYDHDRGHDENVHNEEKEDEQTEDGVGRSGKSSNANPEPNNDEEDDKNDGNSKMRSPVRDEAEAESDEDFVPNYDENSGDGDGMFFNKSDTSSKDTTVVPGLNALTRSTGDNVVKSSEDTDVKDAGVDNVNEKSDVAMESDGVEDNVEDGTSDSGDKEKFQIIAPTPPKGSENSTSTSTLHDESNVATSASAVKSCPSPDITLHSPIRTRHRKVSSSNANPARKAKLNSDLDKEKSQSQPVSTPSQSQPAQSKSSGMKPRGDKAAPATTELITRRVTRAQETKIKESSEETHASKGQGASAPTKAKGRGRVGEATPRKD